MKSKMGLPAPVPAASLSSEDESSMRSDQDSPAAPNKSLGKKLPIFLRIFGTSRGHISGSTKRRHTFKKASLE